MNFNRIAINLIHVHCWLPFSPILHQIKHLSNKGKQSAIEWRWISYLEQIFIKRVQPRPQSTHLAFPLTSLDIYHIPWNMMHIFNLSLVHTSRHVYLTIVMNFVENLNDTRMLLGPLWQCWSYFLKMLLKEHGLWFELNIFKLYFSIYVV